MRVFQNPDLIKASLIAHLSATSQHHLSLEILISLFLIVCNKAKNHFFPTKAFLFCWHDGFEIETTVLMLGLAEDDRQPTSLNRPSVS